jgi:hypothetical protein
MQGGGTRPACSGDGYWMETSSAKPESSECINLGVWHGMIEEGRGGGGGGLRGRWQWRKRCWAAGAVAAAWLAEDLRWHT